MPIDVRFLRDPRFAGWRAGAFGPGAGMAGGIRLIRWPMRVAVLSGLLVGVLPLIAVVLLAVGVGVVVYICCAVVDRVGQAIGLGGGSGRGVPDASGPSGPQRRRGVDVSGGDGRENVRVMPRG